MYRLRLEGNFIIKNIYPFLLIMLLCGFLTLSLVLDGIIKKRTKEFSIYIMNGAHLYNLLIRLLTFFSVIIIFSLCICIWTKLVPLHEISPYIIMGVFLILIFAMTIMKKLLNKNLSENLRNGASI